MTNTPASASFFISSGVVRPSSMPVAIIRSGEFVLDVPPKARSSSSDVVARWRPSAVAARARLLSARTRATCDASWRCILRAATRSAFTAASSRITLALCIAVAISIFSFRRALLRTQARALGDDGIFAQYGVVVCGAGELCAQGGSMQKSTRGGGARARPRDAYMKGGRADEKRTTEGVHDARGKRTPPTNPRKKTKTHR